MPLILPGNVGSATAATGFSVDNSCRFDGASSVMYVDTSSASTNKVTISAWIKRSKITADGFIITSYRDDSNRAKFGFGGSDNLTYFMTEGGTDTEWNTTAVFRDTGAWMHVVAQLDNTQATFANRCKLFVNGVEYATSSSGSSTQNSATAIIGNGTTSVGNSYYGGAYQGNWFGGYMAQVAMIQGVIHAPTDFGEFDSDSPTIWKPINITGLTYASYSFLLDFEDSSNLGNNASGSGLADLTEAGLAATDQSIDTCTNNFATMNPLDNFYQATAFSEGNLKLVYTSGNRTWNTCNVALSSGKWYCEILKGETNNDKIGIHYKLSAGLTDRADNDSGAWSYLGGKNADDGGVKTGGSTITYTIAPSNSGDIVQLFLDLDNNKLYFGVNGTVAHSGVGIDIPAVSTLENGQYYIFGGSSSATETMTHTWNFGSPAVAISSANTDAEGFGSFEFSPSGTFDSASKDFLAICTKNLAEYGG